MTWHLIASACLPNEILKSITKMHLKERVPSTAAAAAADMLMGDGSNRRLASPADGSMEHDDVTAPARTSFGIKDIKFIDTSRIQLTSESGGVIMMTQNSIELDSSFHEELSKMGFSCDDGTRTCDQNGVSYIGNEGNEFCAAVKLFFFF